MKSNVNCNYNFNTSNNLCINCGIPLDAEYFDQSGIAETPAKVGESIVLTQFTLHPQYCGVLEYFSQYTDLFFKDQSQIETPGLEWILLINNRPLYPYLNFKIILNPWGFGCFPVNIRLDENATIEFKVRKINNDINSDVQITRVGGRIMGRYWYNSAYGTRMQQK